MRPYLRALAVLALTGGLLAFFLRSANLGHVWQEMRGGDPGLLLLSFVCTSATYLLRSARWRLLLRPLGAVRLASALQATIIGFGLSALLPARPGEVVRPYLLARREGISAAGAFATILLERLLDLVAVLLLLGGCLVLFGSGVRGPGSSLLRAVEVGGAVTAAAALAALGMMFAMAGRPEFFDRTLGHVRQVLPEALGSAVERLAGRFTVGLDVVRQLRGFAGALGWSLANWFVVALSVWTVALAYRLSIPFPGSFIMLALLVVGMAVPTPGSIGGFHAAFQIGATTLYAVPPDRAAAAAIVLHAMAFVPVAAVSMVLMAREGLNLAAVRRLASSDLRSGDGALGKGGATQQGSSP